MLDDHALFLSSGAARLQPLAEALFFDAWGERSALTAESAAGAGTRGADGTNRVKLKQLYDEIELRSRCADVERGHSARAEILARISVEFDKEHGFDARLRLGRAGV
jgi:hypothetical protein